MKFEVYDDFISPTYQNILESLLSDYNTRWSYQPHMDYGERGAPQFLIGVLAVSYTHLTLPTNREV